MPLNAVVLIDYLRDDKPAKVATEITEQDRNEVGGHELNPLLKGAVLNNLPAKYRNQYQGVLIATVARNSAAWQLGLRSGDLITAVDKREIATLKQMVEQMLNASKTPLLNIYRNGRNYLLPLEE